MRSVGVCLVHHLKDGLHQLHHLRQLYEATPIHVVHTETHTRSQERDGGMQLIPLQRCNM